MSVKTTNHILQIVPHPPGTFDGVGDYALNLARKLSAQHGLTTVFAVARETAIETNEGFQVVSGLGRGGDVHSLMEKCDHVILHYVNYGYQARGVPFGLRQIVRQLREKLRGRWLTTFHELYAWGPPWKSEFWLHPFQVKIARDLIDLSDVCVVSNLPIEREIHRHDARKKVYLAPVMSNFGEPELHDFNAASPRRWAICGGAVLLARSLRSFEQMHPSIPDAFAPDHLDVIGGHEQNSIRALVERLGKNRPGLSCHYHPEVSAEAASQLLRKSSLGWIDYFGDDRVSPGMLLKSTAFAAFCAHGIVPILAHQEGTIAINGASLPGPYYMTGQGLNFPAPERLRETQQQFYSWYHARGDSTRAARTYAEALR
ncbi:MAG: hypothetical protein QOK24_2610 [Verrucomicrobiota bacterium]|jgi:hypothetical protein